MRYRIAIALTAIAAAIPLGGSPIGAQAPAAEHSASGFTFVKTIDQALCQTVYTGGFLAAHYTRGECTRVDFNVTNTDASSAVTARADRARRRRAVPDADRIAPVHRPVARRLPQRRGDAGGQDDDADRRQRRRRRRRPFFVNALGADVSATAEGRRQGLRARRGHHARRLDPRAERRRRQHAARPVRRAPSSSAPARRPARCAARSARTPPDRRHPSRPACSFPAAATRDLTAGAEHELPAHRRRRRDRCHLHRTSSAARGPTRSPGSGAVELVAVRRPLILENKFVSSVGWVKPGQPYPFRVFVKNFTDRVEEQRLGDDPGADAA